MLEVNAIHTEGKLTTTRANISRVNLKSRAWDKHNVALSFSFCGNKFLIDEVRCVSPGHFEFFFLCARTHKISHCLTCVTSVLFVKRDNKHKERAHKENYREKMSHTRKAEFLCKTRKTRAKLAQRSSRDAGDLITRSNLRALASRRLLIKTFLSFARSFACCVVARSLARVWTCEKLVKLLCAFLFRVCVCVCAMTTSSWTRENVALFSLLLLLLFERARLLQTN